jgi:hypothetical protein
VRAFPLLCQVPDWIQNWLTLRTLKNLNTDDFQLWRKLHDMGGGTLNRTRKLVCFSFGPSLRPANREGE